MASPDPRISELTCTLLDEGLLSTLCTHFEVPTYPLTTEGMRPTEFSVRVSVSGSSNRPSVPFVW
jgi:hypothetical protein